MFIPALPFHSGPSHHSLRVASLAPSARERPEQLRRVGLGCWPCVIWRFHHVHPHPPPRPLSANALVSSQSPTCRLLCKQKPTRLLICHIMTARGVVNCSEFNMNSEGLKNQSLEVAFFVRDVPPLCVDYSVLSLTATLSKEKPA